MRKFLDHSFQDLGYALRQFRKSPGFTAVAILSLAVGIGANTAIFSLINALMLKSLPVHEPEKLISFGKATDGGQVDGVGPGALDIFPYDFYKRVEQEHEPFQDVCALGSFLVTVSVRSGAQGPAAQAVSSLVSGNFFSVLGAQPLLGRSFTARDSGAPGGNPVTVVSYRYWQEVLGADRSAIGQSIIINQIPFTVIGVMPPKFFGVELNAVSPDMWLPVTMQQEVMMQPSLLNPHGLFWLHLIARRRDEVSIKQAQAWITTRLEQFMVARDGAQISAQREKEIQQIYIPLLLAGGGLSHLREQFEQPLRILMGVVALVLLNACANLANFLLSTAMARERELSTRLALGSSRWRIGRQLLTEALLLSLFGGALGLILAFWGTGALVAFLIAGSKHTALEATPDIQVLIFTIGASLITGILVGIAPALRGSRTNLAPTLASNTRTPGGSGGQPTRRLSKVLVATQVTLSLVLLVAAGLFLRTLENLSKQNFGFERHNLLLIQFNAKLAGYESEQLTNLYDRMLARLNALPGVQSAALSGTPPIHGGSWNSPIFIRGYTPAPHEDISTLMNRVSPGYFETVGIPLLAGRSIGRGDNENSPKAVVVNQTMADHFFPEGNAIGHEFTIADPGVPGSWQIVGIVGDTKYNSPREKPKRMVYLPVAQLANDNKFAYWVQLRTKGDPASVAAEVRAALAEVDPNLSILHMNTITEQVDQYLENERLISLLSSFFSLLALCLATIGLYGVMTYAVVRRTNEIGIRMALGAQKNSVLWMVLKESLLLLVTGGLMGISATLASKRLIQSQLFGLSAADPLTIFQSVVAVCAVMLLAAYFPARRAATVDPMVALRYE